MEQDGTELHEVISQALEAAAPDLADLAAEAGFSPHALWRWRKGSRTPRPESLRRVADVLERRSDELGEWADRLRDLADSQGADPGG